MRCDYGRVCDFPRCPNLAVLTVGLVLDRVNEARELCAVHAREALEMADSLGVAPRLSRICEYGVVLDYDDAIAEIGRAESLANSDALMMSIGELLADDNDPEAKARAHQASIDWLNLHPGATGPQLARAMGVKVRTGRALLGNLKRYGLAEWADEPGRYRLTRLGLERVSALQRVDGAA